MAEKNNENALTEEEKEKVEIRQGKFFAAIAYMWALCFFTLWLKKDNKFAMHHGKNGLLLFLSWLACLVVSIIPILGHLAAFIGVILIMILSVSGIIHSLKGEYWHMPFLGDEAEKLNIES